MKRPLIAIACCLATTLHAEPEDPVTALIRAQTDLASHAGQEGDQATVDRLTDEQVLFSAGDGTVQRDPSFDSSDAVSLELKASTAAFHAGDGEASRRAADHSAMFIDQTGAANPVSDVAGRSGAVGNWVLHHAADVAVASFTLQTGPSRVLAVEIWHRGDGGWRLIGGQTIPLYVDPAAAALPREALDGFVGAYSAGPGSVVVIARSGDSLTANAGGGHTASMVPQSLDLFFTPGLPAGYPRPLYAFRRDPMGHVCGYTRNGVVYSRVDPAAAGAPAAAPPPGILTLREFRVLHVGDVAVAAFYHDRDTPFFGQNLHQTFRSMETWIQRGDSWKMISSQGRQM